MCSFGAILTPVVFRAKQGVHFSHEHFVLLRSKKVSARGFFTNPVPFGLGVSTSKKVALKKQEGECS